MSEMNKYLNSKLVQSLVLTFFKVLLLWNRWFTTEIEDDVKLQSMSQQVAFLPVEIDVLIVAAELDCCAVLSLSDDLT